MELTDKSTNSNSSSFSMLDTIADAFNANLLDENACRFFMLKKLYPHTPLCPECSQTITDTATLNNFWNLKRCKCKACNKWFSATSKTFLQGSQLSMGELILIAVFSRYEVDVKNIAAILKIHPDTVRMWQTKLRTTE